MIGNPDFERHLLETTYEDIASVTRRTNITGEDKITRAEWVECYKDLICALSFVGDNSRQTEAQHSLEYSRKLFVSPFVLIQPGDRISVIRLGRFVSASTRFEYYEVVGKPVLYATHQEVFLKAVELA